MQVYFFIFLAIWRITARSNWSEVIFLSAFNQIKKQVIFKYLHLEHEVC